MIGIAVGVMGRALDGLGVCHGISLPTEVDWDDG